MLLSFVSSIQHCRNLNQILRGLYIFNTQWLVVHLTGPYVAMVTAQWVIFFSTGTVNLCNFDPLDSESALGLRLYCSSGRDARTWVCKSRERFKPMIEHKTVLLLLLLLLLKLWFDLSNCAFCIEAGLVQLTHSAEIIFCNHQICGRFPQFHLHLMWDRLINTCRTISTILNRALTA